MLKKHFITSQDCIGCEQPIASEVLEDFVVMDTAQILYFCRIYPPLPPDFGVSGQRISQIGISLVDPATSSSDATEMPIMIDIYAFKNEAEFRTHPESRWLLRVGNGLLHATRNSASLEGL